MHGSNFVLVLDLGQYGFSGGGGIDEGNADKCPGAAGLSEDVGPIAQIVGDDMSLTFHQAATGARMSAISRSPPCFLSKCCCKFLNASGSSANGDPLRRAPGLR